MSMIVAEIGAISTNARGRVVNGIAGMMKGSMMMTLMCPWVKMIMIRVLTQTTRSTVSLTT